MNVKSLALFLVILGCAFLASGQLLNICGGGINPGTNCGNPSKKWGYDAALGICVEFDYGGCAGNTNNFLTEALCIATCIDLNLGR